VPVERLASGARRAVGALSARVALFAVAVVTIACASRFTPPVGPGVPIATTEAQQLWTPLADGCAGVRAYNADIRPSGRVAGSGIRGVRLLVAVDRAGHVGVEAETPGPPLFTLRGNADQATLWLPRENRVIRDRPEAILGALVGLELTPARLLAVLVGCVSSSRDVTQAVRIGDVIRVTMADAVIYLAQRDGRWLPRAATFGDLIAEYRDRDVAPPTRIVLRSAEGHTPAVDLTLVIGDRVVNRELPPTAFMVNVPATAVPAAVEDLRPLGSR
jgi:hypothetical protein